MALIIALGGGAYAAFSLPKNSVGQAQIRPNSIGAKKIHPGAVGSAQLRSGSVGAAQIKPGSIGAEALSLPIGASGVTSDQDTIIRSAFCIDGPEVKCALPGQEPVLGDSLTPPHPGIMLVSGTLALSTDAPAFPVDARAGVYLVVTVDGKEVSPRIPVTMGPVQDMIVPFQTSMQTEIEAHSVKVIAEGMGFEWPDVKVTSGAMTTTVLPDI